MSFAVHPAWKEQSALVVGDHHAPGRERERLDAGRERPADRASSREARRRDRRRPGRAAVVRDLRDDLLAVGVAVAEVAVAVRILG
jgi:hypothetical protein